MASVQSVWFHFQGGSVGNEFITGRANESFDVQNKLGDSGDMQITIHGISCVGQDKRRALFLDISNSDQVTHHALV